MESRRLRCVACGGQHHVARVVPNRQRRRAHFKRPVRSITVLLLHVHVLLLLLLDKVQGIDGRFHDTSSCTGGSGRRSNGKPISTCSVGDGTRGEDCTGTFTAHSFGFLAGVRRRIAAASSASPTAATTVLARHRRRRRHQTTTSREFDAPTSSTCRSTPRPPSGYNQDMLIDDEATWIMEEEYRGASKRKKNWKRQRQRHRGSRKRNRPTGDDVEVAPSSADNDSVSKHSSRRHCHPQVFPPHRRAWGLRSNLQLFRRRSWEDERSSLRDKDPFLSSEQDNIWRDEWDDDGEDIFGDATTKQDDKGSAAAKQEEEHPLRTDEWLVKIRVGGLLPGSIMDKGRLFTQSSLGCIRGRVGIDDALKQAGRATVGGPRERVQILRFARNGFVLLVQDNKQNKTVSDGDYNKIVQFTATKTAVGKWTLDHTGLKWDVEVAVPPITEGATASFERTGEPKESSGPPNDGSEYEYDDLAQIAAATADSNAADWGSFAAVAAGGGKRKGRQELDTNDEIEDATLPSSLPSTKHRLGWEMTTRTTTLHYRADIHLNKFGERPRMFKGVVTRDRYSVVGRQNKNVKPPTFLGVRLPPRASLFRPILATFEAYGIGEDTVDTTYRERGFSLETSSQQRRQ